MNDWTADELDLRARLAAEKTVRNDLSTSDQSEVGRTVVVNRRQGGPHARLWAWAETEGLAVYIGTTWPGTRLLVRSRPVPRRRPHPTSQQKGDHMMSDLYPPAVRNAVIDLVLKVDNVELRRDLIARIGQGPGAVAVRHLEADIGEISVADLHGEWHVVGALDFGTCVASADWN